MKVTLPATLDIHHAASFLEQCRTWADAKGQLHINASAPERITTPALQILLAMLAHRRSQKRTTTITAPSEAFTQATGFLGLEQFFKEHIAHG